MDQVHNLEQAERWFLKNHAGKVLCVKGKETFEAECYPDAYHFFKGEDE